MKKKLIAIVASLAMVATLVPATAFAAESSDKAVTIAKWTNMATGDTLEGVSAGAAICPQHRKFQAGRSEPLFLFCRYRRMPGEIPPYPKVRISGGFQGSGKRRIQKTSGSRPAYRQGEAGAGGGDNRGYRNPHQRAGIYHGGGGQARAHDS